MVELPTLIRVRAEAKLSAAYAIGNPTKRSAARRDSAVALPRTSSLRKLSISSEMMRIKPGVPPSTRRNPQRGRSGPRRGRAG